MLTSTHGATTAMAKAKQKRNQYETTKARESATQSSLLRLPAELRNKIYDLVLNDTDNELLCPFIWQCSPSRRKYSYSLTQTCRQLRQETLQMWHAGKVLLFAMRADNMEYYRGWLHRRPEAAFASIRRMRLEDYQHCKVRCPQEHPFYCRSAIVINLAKSRPVSWTRDPRCLYCPAHDNAVDRVNAVVRSKSSNGRWVLTKEKLEEIFEAAAWDF
jgi:hypothetical protein